MICSVADLMPLMEEMLAQGKEISLGATGSSMWPLIRHGDDVRLAPVVESEYHRGMVLLFRNGGNVRLHRLARVEDDGLFFLGDGMLAGEGPIATDAVIAQVVAVRHNGHWRRLDRGWWHCLGLIWLALRLVRRPLLAILLLLARCCRYLFHRELSS